MDGVLTFSDRTIANDDTLQSVTQCDDVFIIVPTVIFF